MLAIVPDDICNAMSASFESMARRSSPVTASLLSFAVNAPSIALNAKFPLLQCYRFIGFEMVSYSVSPTLP